MLCQRLWIMACDIEPVVVNHGVLYRANNCESWWVLLCQWLLIMVCYAESVVVNCAVLCLWVMVSYTEQVAVNHGLLCYASGCESWCVMLSQWLWIMVSYAEPNSCESCCVILSRVCLSYGVLCRAIGYKWYESVVVNHGVLCWTSGCESWCGMLTKWLWIMVCNAEQVVESFWVMLSQWLWVMVCNAEPVVVNHGVLCWASGC
jgi:hypothetical protein